MARMVKCIKLGREAEGLDFPLVGATTLSVSLSASATVDQVTVCPPKKLVLPLDHGPRAQTTPYLN